MKYREMGRDRPREQAEPVLAERIPAALRSRRQWVAWRRVVRDGKETKVPVSPHTGALAAVDQAATWGTYPQACHAVSRFACAGVGFVFADDPYCGIDLDHCRDAKTGTIEPWAQRVVARLRSYTEISPSGTGLHVIVQGSLPPGGRRRDRIEVYDTNRYFCTTGWHLAGTPTTIEPRDTELRALHTQLFGTAPRPSRRRAAGELRRQVALTDAEVLARAMRARNGAKVARLWTGKWEGEYTSQSEADLALCGLLAFYSADPAQVDRLFRQSNLMRPKWDERSYADGRTYGQETVAKAIAERRDVWHGVVGGGRRGRATRSR